jgi:hypothetical protein
MAARRRTGAAVGAIYSRPDTRRPTRSKSLISFSRCGQAWTGAEFARLDCCQPDLADQPIDRLRIISAKERKMRNPLWLRALAAGVATTLLMSGAAHAAVSFTFVSEGVALPALPPAPNPCPPPPALPLNCDITAIGLAQTVSGDMFSPWQFSSVFQIDAEFAITGTFLFDDPSAANNDFFGTITGVFNPQSFSSMIDSIVTGGSGIFTSASGQGSEVVQITPSNQGPPTFVSRGQFTVPEPSTAGLLLVAGWMVAALRRSHARRRDVPAPR